jgi:hypothetical protein
MMSLPSFITRLLLFFLLLAVPFSSCKKDEFLTDGDVKLNFSEEKILFDTVFVSVGSVTKNFKVYNPYNQPVKTNIRMAGNGINFRMNVNGLPGRSFNNVEIRAKDSLWIFVEVTVDPGTGNLPFVISDSIIFETNGNQQDVDLVAWGQNAHFIVADHFPSGLPSYALIDPAPNANVTWDSVLPYVIYGFAVVDEGQTLTIDKGTQIHFYNNSGLWVYKGGTLKVQGTPLQPVVFQGSRRESDFAEEPGQWDRIWLNNGSFSEINYAIIKNGFIGLQCDVFPSPAAADQLLLSNTEIRNMSGAGIYSTNFTIKAWNDLITSCGAYTCALTAGGDYDFVHCTFADFWSFGQRSTPSVFINNYQTESNAIVVYNLDSARFSNCIIEGDQDDELGFDFITNQPGVKINYIFRNTLIKATQTATSDSHFINIRRNYPTGFSPADNNWMPGVGSGADNFGDPSFLNANTVKDLRDRIRNTPPDAGAIEIIN